MLWNQEGRTITNTLMPHLAYQGQWLFLQDLEQRIATSNQYNGISINDAHILHLHSSRNAELKLQLMKEFNKQYNENT